jgi:hypothetical protein
LQRAVFTGTAVAAHNDGINAESLASSPEEPVVRQEPTTWADAQFERTRILWHPVEEVLGLEGTPNCKKRTVFRPVQAEYLVDTRALTKALGDLQSRQHGDIVLGRRSPKNHSDSSGHIGHSIMLGESILGARMQ